VLVDAKQQSEKAGSGVRAIGREIQSITELKQSIISSTEVIKELIEMSRKIKTFVTTIVDMTKKTNLLALNAGIEAARAGEAGKSFSVVAEEIKNLAGNSNQSAEDITAILQDVQNRTAEVIEMIKMTEKIEENIRTFYQTGDIFIGIVKDVKSVERIISSISSYTDEHYTDSELMFKIVSEFYKKTEDYNKLADRMYEEVNSIDRAGSSVYAGIDAVIDSINKIRGK
jgi:methyl-accepting chemotaxis protein